MMAREPEKKFDWIAFKREAQAEMYQQMKRMTVRQPLDFLRE